LLILMLLCYCKEVLFSDFNVAMSL
jgi:hypothetical protein